MGKHILFVNSWYPTPEKKSHGIFFKRHAESAALSNDISSIHISSGKEQGIDIFTEEKVFTILAYYKKVNTNFPFLSSLLKLWRSLLCFTKAYHVLIQKKSKPDLVLLNVIFPAGIYVLWLYYLKNIPFIIQEQWSGYYPEDGNYKGFIMKYITKLCVKKAGAVVVVSNKLEQSMKAHGLHQSYCRIGNVVNTNLFVIKNKLKKNDVFRFIHVSTVNDKEKNISGIIQAASVVYSKGNAFVIEIIGDGPERKDFEALAEQYGLLNKVIFFHGYCEPQKVADMMSQSDGFILNSNYEGLPCVLIEAMSCGLPVISTKVGAVPEIIEEEHGLLIERGNTNQLSNAMIDLMHNYKRYDRDKIRNYVVEKFSYSAVSHNFEVIFNQALEKKK
ncbi:MAG: glycosyltransferase [Bacteroidia bacterium]|nr:glycosyltransferase [Bacteroidia bacterium]MCZ2248642.1 glycosyltransferase [Bacteroidia bacterium]